MAFPASPKPTWYATVTNATRSNIYYVDDLNSTPAPPNVTWKVGSVIIKST